MRVMLSSAACALSEAGNIVAAFAIAALIWGGL